ncbi:hypothetical protein A4S06_04960 [Erysipelotrichaceae bacterium MTC7]|nr:hypothetical protein A4S06_04960 [Erysipelotrichaceae bacterium MTC7]
MIFEEISTTEFDAYARSHPLHNFMQTSQMGEVGKISGLVSYYVGVRENGKLIGACRLAGVKNRLGQYFFSAFRGPLLNYENEALVAFFTKEVKTFLKAKKGYALDIDPAIIHLERDINGDPVPGGIDHTPMVAMFEKLGYQHVGFQTEYDITRQGRWLFVLDLEGKSETEVFKAMKQNHRNIIKKTEKFFIEIKEVGFDELEDYKRITEETGQRRGFEDRSLAYYKEVYKQFHDTGEVKFLIAYLNVNAYIESLQNSLIKEHAKYEKAMANNPEAGKTKELGITVNSLQKRLREAQELLSDGTYIPLSAAMFMLYEDEITYMFSGSYEKYMNFYAQYAIQWYMIKLGIAKGYKRYNFYGISGNFDKSDPEYGVYEFKKGFQGYVVEYLGNFVLPISAYYTVNKLIAKIKN